MPDVEPLSWWVDLLPADRPATAHVLNDLAGHVTRVAATLPAGYNLQVRSRDAIDEPDDPVADSPARRAASLGNASGLVSPLRHPKDYEEISPTGRTLLHVAAGSPIERAVPRVIDHLVRRKVPLDVQERVLGNTALHLAVERLVNSPASTVCDDRYQRRAMLQRVERLLAHGANPNVANRMGNTALHQVFCEKSPQALIGQPIPWVLIDRLLQAGADPDRSNRVGIAPRPILVDLLLLPLPSDNPGERRWWTQRPAQNEDVPEQWVAREAVALRLNLVPDAGPDGGPPSSRDPRRRL